MRSHLSDPLLWVPRVEDLPPSPLPLPHMVWSVLYGRGYSTPDALQKCLKSTLHDLRNPFSLDGMESAVSRLVTAFKKKETVCVYADFDLDGTSGLALLMTGLQGLGFEKLIPCQPRRLEEGYGVHVNLIENIRQTAQVLVTVDVGTSAVEVLTQAQNQGLDVIVTDHHLPGKTLPEVLALINPNKGHCPSGLHHLAGVGVAFYLFLAVRRALLEQDLIKDPINPKSLLDFFVIGTITDMVDLRDENRILTQHGLWQLTHTQRPGFRALLEKLDLAERPLTSQDVALRIAPKLNALSRLETNLRPIDILLETEQSRAYEMVDQVLALNAERVRLQKSAESEAMETLLQKKPKNFVWVRSNNFHRGVIGLVATKLSQQWNLPAFVGSLDSTGRIVGSSRVPSLSNINLVEALTAANVALERFGGHKQAAGFELNTTKEEEFSHLLTKHFSDLPPNPPSQFIYDAEGELEDISAELMGWHEHLGPFGAKFENPIYRLKNLQLSQCKEMRGGHLRLSFSSAKGHKRIGVWFSPQQNQDQVREFLHSKKKVEALVELEWNHYQGNKTLQLQIKDLRACSERCSREQTANFLNSD
ncbi:MAG: single-stranded-DNA-specific exonuclease RecJ [Bdellovibrionales bacterium]|nr:single-stranded-DNA-specific exonuclease RecJ [Bdellovibrionales bacterium]